MARQQRETILINNDGERREYASEYAAAKALGVSVQSVQQAKRWNAALKGWRVFDTPEKIKERISELKEQIKFLEG